MEFIKIKWLLWEWDGDDAIKKIKERTVGKNEYYYECVLINKFTLMC